MSRNELLGEVALIESHSMLGSKLSCPILDEPLHDKEDQHGFGKETIYVSMANLPHSICEAL